MGRHELAMRPDLEVVVGWDPPLQTFFVQVLDPTKDEDDPDWAVVWDGCSPREIEDPRRVADLVRPHVSVPDDLVDRLTADKEADR